MLGRPRPRQAPIRPGFRRQFATAGHRAAKDRAAAADRTVNRATSRASDVSETLSPAPVAATRRPDAAGAPAAPAGGAGTSATVLTVDDEPSVLSALRRLLRLHGYTVVQATGGAEGLAILDEKPVDLVISDMRMPGMDGARFLEEVRRRDPGVVRIVLTGYADIDSTIAAINRGEIHRYLTKPWDDQDLLLVLREALERRALESRNAELQALTQAQNEELARANQTLEARVAARTAELQQVNGMLEVAYEDLNRNFTLAVTVLVGLMEMRENGIAGHSRRVATIARDVAVRLGAGEREQQDVYLAALLHDVGKIAFPDTMLGKATSLFTDEETVRYRRHPVDGETALMPLAQLQGVAKMVRQHHERFDGKGFPDGLAGEGITLGGRILAVVADHDDLLHGAHSQRCYTHAQARVALRGAMGTHYDPKVVEATFAVLDAMEALASAEVELDVRELQPHMVLARDLVSPRGAILLATGYVFDAELIRRVCDFAEREKARLSLFVRRESITRPISRLQGGGVRP